MRSFIDKILTLFFVVAIVGSIGALSYVIANPRVEEKFTEFYLLGLEGKAIDYPENLKAGEEGRVLVGIVNREQEPASYRLEVVMGSAVSKQIGPIELAYEEKWEQIVGFTPATAGEKQKVEFLLYKEEQKEPYLKLHLWINVAEAK